MATYIGFNTINTTPTNTTVRQSGAAGGSGTILNPIQLSKKFRLVDEKLVVQDFINALNIPQGQCPGKPGYGTSLWNFIFEPNTIEIQQQIDEEITRVASLDSRLILNSVKSYPQENGILIEVEMAVSPFNDALTMQIVFDQRSSIASIATQSTNMA
jgi:hypothetical protein